MKTKSSSEDIIPLPILLVLLSLPIPITLSVTNQGGANFGIAVFLGFALSLSLLVYVDLLFDWTVQLLFNRQKQNVIGEFLVGGHTVKIVADHRARGGKVLLLDDKSAARNVADFLVREGLASFGQGGITFYGPMEQFNVKQ